MTSATPKPRAGEHTKGPWQLHHKGAGGWVFAHPEFGHLDARSIGTDKKAAHEILAALNADQAEHERELVEACAGLLSIMKRLNVEVTLGDAPAIFAARALLAKYER